MIGVVRTGPQYMAAGGLLPVGGEQWVVPDTDGNTTENVNAFGSPEAVVFFKHSRVYKQMSLSRLSD